MKGRVHLVRVAGDLVGNRGQACAVRHEAPGKERDDEARGYHDESMDEARSYKTVASH